MASMIDSPHTTPATSAPLAGAALAGVATTRFAPLAAAEPLRAPRTSGGWKGRIVWLLVAIVVLAAGAWGVKSLMQGLFSSAEQDHIVTHRLTRSELLVTVTEPGNVESAANIDVKAHVAGGSTILWIIADGTEVKKGDLLVRLESSALEDQINQQRIVYERAVASKITAEKEFSAAKIAVQEYIEGNYVKELQIVESQITVALENHRSSENSLEHTTRLARKGYVTPLQLDAQKFAVERAKLDLETARVAKTVLEKFAKVKMIEDLETKRDTNEARMRSEQAACDLEQARLKRLQAQLENCQIMAPQDGMVVYANESSSGSRGGGSSVKIEEGAGVRDQQTIVRLPDLSQMQVRVLVHESKVESLAPGMRAQIRIQDRVFQGEVKNIANQPEPTSFFSANVKEYATYVRLDGAPDNLKPGMTAEVEILAADLKSALAVPVQAVVEQGGKLYCWVHKNGHNERRPVLIGVTNTRDIEIKDGLAEGDLVVLNPRTVIPDARAEVEKDEKVDVTSKFGNHAPRAAGPIATMPTSEGSPPVEKKAGPGKGAGQQPSFTQLDKNSDGKITEDEMPEQMRQYASRMDTNNDGGIDAKEFAAARARRAQQPGAAGGPGASGGPPSEGAR